MAQKPTPIAAPDEAELREILAEEFDRNGCRVAARNVREKSDNLFEGNFWPSILAAMSRVRPTGEKS